MRKFDAHKYSTHAYATTIHQQWSGEWRRIDCFNIDAIFQMNGENFNWLKRPHYYRLTLCREGHAKNRKEKHLPKIGTAAHFFLTLCLLCSLSLSLALSPFIYIYLLFILHSLWADQHSSFYPLLMCTELRKFTCCGNFNVSSCAKC